MRSLIILIVLMLALATPFALDTLNETVETINQDVLESIVREMNAAGTTILFSTHLMDQAEQAGCGVLVLTVDGPTIGKAKFQRVTYRPSDELPDDAYPLVLSTGRTLYHYNAATQTRRDAGPMAPPRYPGCPRPRRSNWH